MGLLVDGVWHDQWYDTKKTGGKFVREQSKFRCSLEGGETCPYPPDSGRYHLYVSLACPWAHRALILRKLKGLEPHIGLSIVDSYMGADGWRFADAADDATTGSTRDNVHGYTFLRELYTHVEPKYTGRVTVPVLYDTADEKIVCNESADILRIFNSAFDELDGVDASVDFYPEPLRDAIDEINAFVYDRVNNGVYKAGFATKQDAYEQAFDALFAALDELDERLANRRYLVGEYLTEADWRLFTTLVRFDAVYFGHFKCNRRRIADYANLSNYLRELYQVPGVADTVNFEHIKHHYYASHRTINPTGIVPKGPLIDLAEPHDRDRLSGKTWRAV